MTRYAITKEELEALNPCDLDERLKLFGGRERLTVAHALEAGVTVSDVLWTAGRMGHKAECVRFAVACAESVAHLSHDPRVRAAIEAAKAWIASPTEENAAATYVAAYAADAAGVVAAHRGARAAAYAARTASYAAADAAAYAADAARTASYAAKAEEQAKYAADAAGEPFDGKTLLLKIFADKGGRTMTQKLETLVTALNAYQAAVRSSDPHAAPRAESRLMDACIACGASFDEPSFEEWAAGRVAAWLVSA